MNQNVKIPVILLNETVYILETLKLMELDESIHDLIDSVLCEYRHKKDTMALRETYAKIVCAENDDERFNARMKYLEERRRLKDYQ